MSIVKAITGETLSIETWFRDTSGQPRTPVSGGASYAIRDFTGALVISGAGIPDGGDASRWFATATLPSNCPISSTGKQKYSLVWSLEVNSGSITTTEYFDVYPAGDAIKRLDETDVLFIEGTPFSDSAYIETVGVPAVTSVSFGIVDETGNVIKPMSVVTASGSVGTASLYAYGEADSAANLPGLTSANGMGNYMGVWTTIRAGGGVEHQIHPIYVVNFTLFRYMDSIQKLVDRARIGNTQPHLEITNIDLIHHLFRGMEFVGSAPPNITPITPNRMPSALADFVIKAGAVSLLKAMYLSEGMTNFDFQGLGVQLAIDRTPYIDNMISRLENDLGEALRAAKSTWIRAGMPTGTQGVSQSPFYNKVAVMNVSVGAYSNIVSSGYLPYLGPYFGPTQLWRGFSPINGFGG